MILHLRVVLFTCSGRSHVRAGYWDDCAWSEDWAAGPEPVHSSPTNVVSNMDADTGAGMATHPIANVLLARPGPLVANLDTDMVTLIVCLGRVEATGTDTPQVQPGGDESYVAPAPTSGQTAWESISSISKSPPGVRRFLQVCTYCLRDLRGKQRLTDVSCMFE